MPSPLLVVTDRHQARRPLEQIVAEVLSAGARWIWFRDRDLEVAERRQLAMRLVKLVRGAGGCLSIGSDLELAVEAGDQEDQAVALAGSLDGSLLGVPFHGKGDCHVGEDDDVVHGENG